MMKRRDPGPSSPSAAHEPFFLVRMQGGRAATQGQADAEFGHRLPSAGHGVDDGVFAGWHWDGTRLVAGNDRYGFQPLFWTRFPDGGVGVSPSLARLIEHGAPTELDIEALAVFFRLGFFIGDDTPFAAIKAMPPDAVFAWSHGTLECHGRFPRVRKASTLSRDDAIDAYIDHFARAMARRTPGSDAFAVPVSGGRDSRHILLELHRTGLRPAVCVSALDNPPDPNQDPAVAGQLCAALGFGHVVIEQQLSVLSAQVRKNRETHFCATAHGWYLALADFLSHRFDCVYDGIAGDVLSQSSYLDADLDAVFRSRDARLVADALLGRNASTQTMLDGLLKGRLRAALDPEVARHRLSGEVARHLDMPNPIASFFFWNRTRRQIALAPHALLKGIPRVHAPFLDHDLFDFAATLPADMLMDRAFHTDAIARAYPAFAHIPYADHKHAPPADDGKVRARFLAEATRRFVLRKPSSWMRNTVPRLKMLAGCLSRGRVNPSIPMLIVYLDQLESVVRDRR